LNEYTAQAKVAPPAYHTVCRYVVFWSAVTTLLYEVLQPPSPSGPAPCPRLAAVRRRLSANEVTPDSRPGCYRGVELSCPKRRHTDSFRMALSVCSPPVLHGITSGLSPDPSSSPTPTWGRLPNCQRTLPTGLIRPERTPVMQTNVPVCIRSASLHAFRALLRVVFFGPVLADGSIPGYPCKEDHNSSGIMLPLI